MANPFPVLDETHLARQTFGDAALAGEVVELFIAQLAGFAARLEDADSGGQAAMLHNLKGSARAVGAMALAGEAEALEGSGAANPDKLLRVLAATLAALRARQG